ncbi:hypothetical protein [Holdemanella porci]|jgi:hypothetical protein|uniref:hypothetical protein n=1 Tax=Holdemanella porci TaxID=2652276 RepID=UPI003FD884A3
MNARKMFRQLGYERAPEGTYLEDIVLPYRNYKKNITIDFYLEKKTFCKARGVIDCVQINCEEMQAITQQCKELGWLEEEKAKEETNLEHFKEDIVKLFVGDLAVVDGKPKRCIETVCDKRCDFYMPCNDYTHDDCVTEWLKEPYKKSAYKLTQFEYDLLQHFSVDFKFKEMGLLKEMKEKGHFKNINGDELIKDILESCEVIK